MLLRLNLRGTGRRMLRGVKTPRGLVFLLLGVVVLCLWLGPSFYFSMKMPTEDAKIVLTAAPFAMLAFCIGNLVSSVGENAVAFTGAEVDFLFPGPFTRRSLLAFKIFKTALGTLATTVIFTFILLRYSGWWVSCAVGVWLTIQFMQLFSMAAMMLAQTFGERVYGTAKRGILVAIAAVVVVAAGPKISDALQHGSPMELMRQIHSTVAGKVLLAPFDVFAHAITSRNSSSLALWAASALAIDLALLTIVFSLDTNYLETAATVSQKRYDRIQRYRRGGISTMSGAKSAGLRVRPLPWLGGVGPIAWRQLTNALRSSRGLLVVLAIITFSGATIALRHRGQKTSDIGPLIGTFVWINVLLVSMLKFDFRNELDRLDLLRSLPIRPIAVATAELIAPVAFLTAVQLLITAVIAAKFTGIGPTLLAAAAFFVPFNLLLVAIENLLFLMFPLRAAGLIAGDMQLFGRQMVVFICKFLLLIFALCIAAAFGTVGYIIGNKSWPAFAVVAWFGLTLVSLSIIPLLARTYARFDPSLDTPA